MEIKHLCGKSRNQAVLHKQQSDASAVNDVFDKGFQQLWDLLKRGQGIRQDRRGGGAELRRFETEGHLSAQAGPQVAMK